MGWMVISERDLTRVEVLALVNDVTPGLVGKSVYVYEMLDGRSQVRAKGVALPCSIFDPHEQRVTHAAITENKHLSAVLAHIREEQEKAAPPPKVKPVSAKTAYKKTGPRPLERPSQMEAYYERCRTERAAEAATASKSRRRRDTWQWPGRGTKQHFTAAEPMTALDHGVCHKRSFPPVTETVEFWHILRCGESLEQAQVTGFCTVH